MKSVPKNMYLKTCSTSFTGTQSTSFSILNSLQRVSKVSSYSSTGRWQMPLLFFSSWQMQMLLASANLLLTGKCQFVVDRNKRRLEIKTINISHKHMKIQKKADFFLPVQGSKFGKLSSGNRIGKGQFLFQSQSKTMPTNVQTTVQLHSCQQGNTQNPSSQASTVQEFPDVQPRFRKGRGTRDQIENICRITEKVREFQKKHLLLLCTKAFDCVDHNELWKILQEMWITDHLTCLLRNVHEGQEATVRTGHGTMDCFKIGKGVC